MKRKLVGSRWRTVATFAEQTAKSKTTGDALREVAKQAYSKTLSELAAELKEAKTVIRTKEREQQRERSARMATGARSSFYKANHDINKLARAASKHVGSKTNMASAARAAAMRRSTREQAGRVQSSGSAVPFSGSDQSTERIPGDHSGGGAGAPGDAGALSAADSAAL